ncbi:MAG: alpha/beta fold hydrolase [Rhizobacter sp.]|nr:alpha/beta fold hydrolase [Rhizobacter sp.]
MSKTIVLWGLLGVALVVLAALGWAAVAFTHDMARAHARVRVGGNVIASPLGDIEYAEGGAGVPVLVVHGSGGGHDQGELIAHAVLGDGFRWIAPSRFGYLRSALPAGASFDEQAHAYARLLDHLGLQRVAVVALSHGGPSALLFAALHPERVSSLTLISAGVASSGDPRQAEANRKGGLLKTVFRHDALYWVIARGFRRQLMALMGADAQVVAALTPAQRTLVDRVIDFMHPVSLRSAGVAFDNAAALPDGRISAVRAPTLIFHARDDTLQLLHNAEYAASHIAGATLVRFERGGHLVLAVEQATVRAMTQRHVMAHALTVSPASPQPANHSTQ